MSSWLGHCHVDTLRRSHDVSLEERVGKDSLSDTLVTAAPSATIEEATVASMDSTRTATWAEIAKGKAPANEKETHGFKNVVSRVHFLETIPSTKTKV